MECCEWDVVRSPAKVSGASTGSSPAPRDTRIHGGCRSDSAGCSSLCFEKCPVEENDFFQICGRKTIEKNELHWDTNDRKWLQTSSIFFLVIAMVFYSQTKQKKPDKLLFWSPQKAILLEVNKFLLLSYFLVCDHRSRSLNTSPLFSQPNASKNVHEHWWGRSRPVHLKNQCKSADLRKPRDNTAESQRA